MSEFLIVRAAYEIPASDRFDSVLAASEEALRRARENPGSIFIAFKPVTIACDEQEKPPA